MNPEAIKLMKYYRGDGKNIGRESAEKIVQQYVANPNLHENQYAALVCFAENVGVPEFITSSVVILVNQGKMLEAANELLLWVEWGGKISSSMIRRRARERDIFQTPVIIVDNQRSA